MSKMTFFSWLFRILFVNLECVNSKTSINKLPVVSFLPFTKTHHFQKKLETPKFTLNVHKKRNLTDTNIAFFLKLLSFKGKTRLGNPSTQAILKTNVYSSFL